MNGGPEPGTLVVASTPLRLSLGGGGTDLPYYADSFGGDVLSIAVSLRVTVAGRLGRLDGRFRYSHEQTLHGDKGHDLGDPYVAAALEASGLDEPCEITSFGPVPAGTGLGSSGAFAVSLLAVTEALAGRDPLAAGRAGLAEAAWQMEAVRLGRPVGRHDPYVCALGGLRRLRIAPDGTTEASTPPVAPATLDRLQQHLCLYYTGVRRDSTRHLAAPARGREDKIAALHSIKEIGHEMTETLCAGRVDDVPALLRRHWEVKNAGAPPSSWDGAYTTALGNGALAGKLVGAGGGGFLLLYADPDRRDRLDAAMREQGLQPVPFTFSTSGTTLTRVHLDERDPAL